MAELKIILVGLGGQGVVFFTRLLSQTAVSLDHPVMVSETHGMSQRGGSVISHLKIGGSEAPLIRRGTADLLLAMEPDEAVRSLPFLRRGGTVIVNAENGLRPEVAGHLARLNISVHAIPAGQMAMDMGTAAVANVILAGFAAARNTLPLPITALRTTLEEIAPRGKTLNLRALDAGYNYNRNP
ncbi:MAG: indolepyruvate oxidoreductase subunit beta [Anaerolineae bacterium]